MKVLRERKGGGGGGDGGGGGRREVKLGFGPEDLDVPLGFILPVLSFGEYGGHASLHGPPASTTTHRLQGTTSRTSSWAYRPTA